MAELEERKFWNADEAEQYRYRCLLYRRAAVAPRRLCISSSDVRKSVLFIG